jgi:acetylxylan esterase
MKSAIAAIPFLLMGSSMAAPLEKRACPNIHIFGARETTAPAGYGSAGTVVNLILNAHPGSTAEVINYPAAGGNSYASSVQAGVKAVTNQINSFAASCPNTQLVYVGYSQGAQIGDDAICGGGDPNQGISSTAAPISAAIGNKIKAIIFMGDPRNIPGGPYSVGTAKGPGVSFVHCRLPDFLLTILVSVRPKTFGVHLLCVRKQNPVLLRLCRPLLLERKRCQRSPRLWSRIRSGCSQVRQQQAFLIYRRWSTRYME